MTAGEAGHADTPGVPSAWPMRRVLVVGCPGSGKSTFARRLCDATGLSLHYLDMLWHKPDMTTVTRDEFDMRLGVSSRTTRGSSTATMRGRWNGA